MLKFLVSRKLRVVFLFIGGLSSLAGWMDVGFGALFAYIISLELEKDV